MIYNLALCQHIVVIIMLLVRFVCVCSNARISCFVVYIGWMFHPSPFWWRFTMSATEPRIDHLKGQCLLSTHISQFLALKPTYNTKNIMGKMIQDEVIQGWSPLYWHLLDEHWGECVEWLIRQVVAWRASLSLWNYVIVPVIAMMLPTILNWCIIPPPILPGGGILKWAQSVRLCFRPQWLCRDA